MSGCRVATITIVMIDLDEVYAPIAGALDRARDIFDEELASQWPFVRDLCGHIQSYRGKMLRPALVLLSARACGRLTRDHVVLAAVVELVHMATLVHDDVLDEAEMRRRAPTINRYQGNEAAVLLGDFLISHAFHLCSSLDSQEASRQIGAATNAVCEGELMQIHHRGDIRLTRDQYLAIISLKTASLTRVCCSLGARFAKGRTACIRALENYGHSLGMAFQIVDDVLDIVGSETRMGKTLGRDLDKAKLTLPLIHFVSNAPRRQRERAAAVLRNGSPDRAAVLRELLAGSDSIGVAMDAAKDYVRAALDSLDVLPASAARNSLQMMAEFITARQF